MSYSQLIHGLNLAGIEVNRKMLADVAVNDIKQFEVFVKEAQSSLSKENPTLNKKETKVETTEEA
jgi:large subunit ribosomal protein L20